MTNSEIKYLQKGLGVEQDGDIGSITRKAFADKLISIASKDVGIFETSKNHGEGIAKYWPATTYKSGYVNREPYCAAACSYWIQQMGVFSEKNRPKTAGAFAFEQWATSVDVVLTRKPKTIKRGQLVVFGFSHIGVATGDSDSNGNFSTIEANTSGTDKGSQRDGGGVHKRTRNVLSVRSTIFI
jgi:hypothetical protein